MPEVSLVIPGRNCSATLRPCLEAAIHVRDQQGSDLCEILYVDDASTDDSATIAAELGVRVLSGNGTGAGAARNVGWRAARGEVIWFVDSDCIPSPDALDRLLAHLDEPDIAAVGGSYDNARPDSRLARWIDAEIQVRHHRMGREVDFLATFNVVYRRSVLEELSGFDERYRKGQDAELAFRTREAGHRLRFEHSSRVAHHHETSWARYLKVQRQQGYWRVFLHLEHSGHSAGDSYSRLSDHLQPPLAMLTLGLLPVVFWTAIPLLLSSLGLALLQGPMAVSVTRQTGRPGDLAFGAFGLIRAYARGIGMTAGVISWALKRHPAG